MMKSLYAGLVAAALLAGTAAAQEAPQAPKPPEQPRYYQLVFGFKETDEGKVTNSRSYVMTLSTEPRRGTSSSRNSTRVPFREGSNTQYFDAGVNIDCSDAKELQDRLSMNVSASVSTVHIDPPATLPVVRQITWRSDVVVPLRKPTVIFSSDDPTTKRQTLLEVTATPIR